MLSYFQVLTTTMLQTTKQELECKGEPVAGSGV